MKDVYRIDLNGYIVSIKKVNNKYILKENEFEGIPNFNLNYHFETGLEKPLTQEQLNKKEIIQLKEEIYNKKIINKDFSLEQAKLSDLLNLSTQTLSEKILEAEQEAKDAQMLELIEGGLI